MGRPRGRYVNLLREFSIPLLAGVVVALVAANTRPHLYREVLAWEPFAGLAVFGHPISFQFLINDFFRVFFFGIAAKEIAEATLPVGC